MIHSKGRVFQYVALSMLSSVPCTAQTTMDQQQGLLFIPHTGYVNASEDFPLQVTVKDLIINPEQYEWRKITLRGRIRNLGENLQTRKGRQLVFSDMAGDTIASQVRLPLEAQRDITGHRPMTLSDVLDRQVRVTGTFHVLDQTATLVIEAISDDTESQP